MRLKAHIYLSGIIGENNDFFSMEPSITVNNVRGLIDEHAGAEEYIFHITTQGGSVMEAFAIHDLIAGLKNTTTIGEGMVASAGTILLLAGGKRKMTKYSELMIHNPFTIAEGDADELQKTVDELQRIEDKLSQFYSDKTGKTAKEFDKWMKAETYMSADEALEMGFINEVVEPMKAVALLPSQTNNQNSFIMNIFEKVRNEIADLKATVLGTPRNLDLTTADGKKFTVNTESNTLKNEPEVNNVVTLEGATAPAGDYIIPALGKTVSVVGGKITAINDTNAWASANDDPNANQDSPEVKALREELQAEKAKNAQLASQVTAQEAAVNEISNEIVGLKAQMISSGFKPTNRAQNFNKSTENKDDKPVNRMAAAAERREEERLKKEGK